jgi:hypothetical protein
MAYNAAIPQSTDVLSQSQIDLLGNFQAINTFVNVNHVPFNSPDQGKHSLVEFPVQGVAPVILGGEIGLYNFLSPVTGVNELYIISQSGITSSVTASILSTTPAPANDSFGWSYLPSGILIMWGNSNANGNTAIVFPVAADIPVFNQVFSIQITTFVNSALDSNTFVRLSAFTNLGFNIYGSQRTAAVPAACSFQYLAIGY